MRDLKFRMVTQTTGKFIGYVDIYDLLRNGSDVLLDFGIAALEGVKFEQYTGLKDRNGKEIYEGDILQDNDGDICKVLWNDDTAEWSIKWLEWDITNSLAYRLEPKHLVIVGNIHENSELLKGDE